MAASERRAIERRGRRGRAAAALLGLVAVAGLVAAATWLARGRPGLAPLAPGAAAAAGGPGAASAPLRAPAAPAPAPSAEPAPATPSDGAVEPEPAAALPGRSVAPDRRRRAGAHVVAGRVLALGTDEPVPDATITLEAPGRAPLATRTDATGAFRLHVPDAPEGTLVARPPEGWIVREPELVLAGRAPPEVVFRAEPWPPPPAGDVAGRLVSAAGPWTTAELARASSIVVDLVSDGVSDGAAPGAGSAGPPRVKLQTRATLERDAQGEPRLAFRFADVPRGSYWLTVSSLDPFRWSPEGLVVAPPAEGLELVRLDDARTRRLAFRVLDAETEEPVEGWRAQQLRETTSPTDGVLVHTGPLDLDRVPPAGALRWCVSAPGYAAAYGDETAFEDDGEGGLVAEVRLRRGWSTRYLVLGRAPTMRPLAGATVVLDGEPVGTTGADGGLWTTREAAPESVAVEYLGWTVERVAERDRVTVILLREP